MIRIICALTVLLVASTLPHVSKGQCLAEYGCGQEIFVCGASEPQYILIVAYLPLPKTSHFANVEIKYESESATVLSITGVQRNFIVKYIDSNIIVYKYQIPSFVIIKTGRYILRISG